MTSHIAIIGAGPGGLVAAKELQEAGLRVTIFEKSIELGGLWNNSGAAWSGMRTNLSKHTCCFSDSPWPVDAPDFPTSGQVADYLHQYAKRNKLEAAIQLNTLVTRVEFRDNIWQLCVSKNGVNQAVQFDGVVIACGVFGRANLPPLKNSERLKSEIIHSGDVFDLREFAGKRVALIGGSFSGYELAASLSQHGVTVEHVLSKSCWVLPRYLAGENGEQPIDLALYRRAGRGEMSGPKEAARKRTEFFLSIKGNPGDYHVDLAINVDDTAPAYVCISDTYLEQVRDGKINVHLGRAEGVRDETPWRPAQLTLESGKSIDIDKIIACTGYQVNLDFLHPSILDDILYDPEDLLQATILDTCIFHPDWPGLGFVGLYRGPYFGVMELQARYIASVFSGAQRHPTGEAATSRLAEQVEIREQLPRPQFPHGDYIGLCDAIAKRLGVTPDLDRSDPLFDMVSEGPVTPFQFRLSGPGAKPEIARKALNMLNFN